MAQQVKLDLTSRNADLAIILFVDLLLLALIVTGHVPVSYSDKFWGVFMGWNGALMLALRSGSNPPPPPPPLAPAGA